MIYLSIILLLLSGMQLDAGPLSSEAVYQIAYMHKQQNNIDKAISWYHDILERMPEHAMSHLGLAQCHLAVGEFEEAWPHFEYRGPEIRSFTQYSWRTANLTGKKVLIRCEWGLGDCIQFIRYAQLIKERGAQVYVQTYKELVPLFSLCPFIDHVITVGQAFPQHDIQVPLLSLPYTFETTIKTIPASIPYLQADPTLVEKWKKRIDPTKYNIGVCWSGGGDKDAPSYLNKNMSSFELEPLTNLKNVQLYALQKFPPDSPASNFCFSMGIETFDEDFDTKHGNFMDTAALMMHLDSIITVDTSIAHLAGALGRPVYILLPYKSDWRWMIDRADSPWYPTATLLRQPNPGDFKSLIIDIQKKITMQQ